jgi:ubiquinone/menaquinone biosynthesis C-methylase UbiE
MKFGWIALEREWRKQLLGYASGNVLEAGVGEGINFKFYPNSITLTGTDMSARLIEKANDEAKARRLKASFIVSPVDKLEFKQHCFDTIVSTFSLSAYEEAAAILGKFNYWCKPGGKILLLEYGLSKYELVSWVQKKWDPYHYRRTGTHISRDILGIIAGSKLQVRKVEVQYAGIVYLVWASLSPDSNNAE